MTEAKFPFFSNLKRVACFKQSFTYGISIGIVTGFVHFLLTSRVKRSSDIGLVSFAISTTGLWGYYRYKWKKERQITRKLDQSMFNAMVGKVQIKEGIEEP